MVNSFNHAYQQMLAVTPKVLAMVVVLVMGYIASRLIGSNFS